MCILETIVVLYCIKITPEKHSDVRKWLNITDVVQEVLGYQQNWKYCLNDDNDVHAR